MTAIVKIVVAFCLACSLVACGAVERGGVHSPDSAGISLSTSTPVQESTPPEQSAESSPAEEQDFDDQIASLQQQIHMLERAVAATTPKQAIETWVRAIDSRNGALEYAMLAPWSRAKQLKSFEDGYWVTGTSSPWLERYQIDEGEVQPDGSYIFRVKFDYRTSDDAELVIDWADLEADDIIVREHDAYWYVVEE
ncbi:MAG: hypothetical protein P0Y55_14105 [Candidatus Cohnella colombiensis]|uniref:Uncharacterized protein n=1 Tax=Candidatus Cohnella colombiensis TaxID=3121368 RepID=A0AA95EVG9_9BACL|nr:MAG: hypothetical protein P0Y55_14105 [Cohnella sp.]